MSESLNRNLSVIVKTPLPNENSSIQSFNGAKSTDILTIIPSAIAAFFTTEDVDVALQQIINSKSYNTVGRLLQELLSILTASKFHLKSTSLLVQRLKRVAIMLGGTDGIIYAEKFQLSTADEIYALEVVLQIGCKYFERYCDEVEGLQDILDNSSADVIFWNFDVALKANIDSLARICNSSLNLLAPSIHYHVTSGLSTLVSGGLVDHTNLQSVVEPIPASCDKLLCLFDTVAFKARIAVLVCAFDAIRNITVKLFWISNFPNCLTVKISQFCDTILNQYPQVKEHLSLFGVILSTFSAVCGAGQVDYLSVARLSRHVPESCTTMSAVVQYIVSSHSEVGFPKYQRLSSPAPQVELVWNNDQRRELTEIFSYKGWFNITGPSGSGKTCRILSLGHALPISKDFVYIDCSKVTSDLEAASRVFCQLAVRKCVGKEDFVQRFSALMKSIQPGSVIVFDNLEDDTGAAETREEAPQSVYLAVTQMLLDAVKFEKNFESQHCFVIVATSPMNGRKPFSLGRNVTQVTVGPLAQDKARELATGIFPADPQALLIASRCIPGEMISLAKCCNLHHIRQIGPLFVKFVNNELAMAEVNTIVTNAMILELTPDEKLCAACLMQDLGYFDEALAWALCQESFDGDLYKWYVAWQGLVRKHWVFFNYDLGYTLSVRANGSLVMADVLATGVLVPTDSELERKYLMHFARQLRRMDEDSITCDSAFQYFDFARGHFRNVLSTVLQPREAGGGGGGGGESGEGAGGEDTSLPESCTMSDLLSPDDPELGECHSESDPDNWTGYSTEVVIAWMLAGNMSRFYSQRCHPTGASCVAKGIAVTLFRRSNCFAQLRAITEYAEQLLRDDKPQAGVKLLKGVLKDAFSINSHTKEFATAFAVLGRLYFAVSKHAKAEEAFQRSLSLWANYDRQQAGRIGGRALEVSEAVKKLKEELAGTIKLKQKQFVEKVKVRAQIDGCSIQ